ncbi:MAG: helix-turn-helix domain-containing protein [Proteobacteria bacterium]|nr:helix-turn-helix domain-containing protein [Pseudomonadota bacterium]
MGKHYDQLDLDDRIEISRLHADGISRRAIGRMMGRSASTIDRDARQSQRAEPVRRRWLARHKRQGRDRRRLYPDHRPRERTDQCRRREGSPGRGRERPAGGGQHSRRDGGRQIQPGDGIGGGRHRRADRGRGPGGAQAPARPVLPRAASTGC